MSDWKIVVPEATTNYCLNPSAEIAGNYAAVGGTVTRVTTYARYGTYSYRVQTAADNQGITLTLPGLANAIHYVTVTVRGTLPAAWDWSLDNATYTAPVLIEALDANWNVYGLAFPAVQANGAVLLYIYQNGAGAGDFYVDGVMVEAKSYWTTYCDGDQPGCYWNNTAHAGTSSRASSSRAGGRVDDLDDDYDLKLGSLSGQGMGPLNQLLDEYAIIPGGESQGYKALSRSFVMSGVLETTSSVTLHALRQALLNVLKPDAVPGNQPLILRYEGATTHKQISVRYEGGLEYGVEAQDCWWERVALRFLAADPYWYAIGQTAAVLDSNDAPALRYVAARFRDTGQWSATGLAADPTAGGQVRAILVARDHSVYVGGDFTGWGGVAGRDYIARYVPGTGWTTVGNASDINDEVRALAEGPDGTIYAGGYFDNAAGVAAADYLAAWDGTAWAAVGVPVQGAAAITAVHCLAFDHSGNLYIGGDFANWADVALADCLVQWDGTNYTAVGTFAGYATLVAIYAISIDSRDYIAVGGDFTNLAGDANADYVAWCPGAGTAWVAVNDTALNGVVYALAHSADDVFYIGGDFTNAAGIANADYIVGYKGYEGAVFFALQTGVNDVVRAIKIAPDGMIYAGGEFNTAGPLVGATGFARWNGAAWELPDVYLTSGDVYAIATGEPDPNVEQNYDVWIGFDSTDTMQVAGAVTHTNAGTETAYPVLEIARAGGTNATIKQVRNETTGKQLCANYALLDGETLTLDLRPNAKSISSSFFGPRASAILRASNVGSWALAPGANILTCLIYADGAPTVTVFATYAESFWSLD